MGSAGKTLEWEYIDSIETTLKFAETMTWRGNNPVIDLGTRKKITSQIY